MAILAESLTDTASSLILKYGTNITLTNEVSSGGYNPQTGEFSINTSSDVIVKAVSLNITTDILKASGLDETAYGSVKRVYTIPYSVEVSSIDNTWKVDGQRVHKVVSKELQGLVLTYQLFVG